ncbi:MAG: heavy-metal-associated domain-containing protein [Kofleriaceae bacterium]|nr:heavy-metal-associated domain-containing protein [Kofleriaceae bacterium]
MSNEQDTILEVQGMSCPSCIRHVTVALTDLDGVDKVDVKLRDGLVVVQHDKTQASIDQLIEALGEAGYVSKQRAV